MSVSFATPVSTSVPVTDWLSWFDLRESTSVINKSSQEKLFKTFATSKLSVKCIKSIVAHEETVFLHKMNFGLKKVSIFHHLIVTGGTAYDSSPKEYGFIQGDNNKTH